MSAPENLSVKGYRRIDPSGRIVNVKPHIKNKPRPIPYRRL